MLEVRTVRLREIRLPLREPFRISSGVTHDRRILLVQLVDGNGREAWGECVAGETPAYSAETIDTARLVLREWLVPRLLGGPIAEPAAVSPMLDAGVRGHRMAKAALEMACWVLEAECRGVALAALLGGTREVIEVGISLGIQPTPADLAARATAAAAEGYRRIKLKIQPGADVAFVEAVRAVVGPDLPLSVDANAAYALADAAHLARLDRFGLVMLEQPLDADDLRRHALLQRQLATPLCLDESITSAARAEDALELDSARIVNVKPGRVGGFLAARAIHDLCARRGVPVWCGGMLESGIGRAHNVALAALPNFTLPGDLSPSRRYWARDIVSPEWTMSADGRVAVPLTQPGLGVAVDLNRVDDLTVHLEERHA
ncbi:MAG: o-succinylbenzoate synthase [Gemmatimonadota bacterium]|nr:o-succinylbenzoate synthase [Gemmatimonadota bacterium]